VSVTTVWAEAVVRAAAKNKEANANHALGLRAELLNMGILLY
jgi:hypothetical protein